LQGGAFVRVAMWLLEILELELCDNDAKI
jgi:hypothetical protein